MKGKITGTEKHKCGAFKQFGMHATNLCGSTAWMNTDTAGSPG